MLIDNVLNLIEEYTAFKQLPRIVKAKKIASASTIASPQQRANMQDSMKKDGKTIARESARFVADSIVPGLGTAGVLGHGVVNLIKPASRRNNDADSPDVTDLIPSRTITTAIGNTLHHAKSNHNDMQDAMERDGNDIARESARFIGNAIRPGLGTAGSLGYSTSNFIKKAVSSKGLEAPESLEITNVIPKKTASTIIRNKLQNARNQYVLDHLKSKADSELYRDRAQKICAQNPGLKGC